ncbi:hypothetical protein GCM10010372_69880 [Streptomyces tauricus]|uniref:Uncharacterized protein n=1 Tax=Streptomyces tauricus TaxID=68274 RepID=A0ABZ1JYD2_9ACTN|nr:MULTISPECIES: hypothetical protein [Streptomyces]UPZ34568.1 hypothetical protein MUK60_29400 [Streptomyces sp. LRE541]GHA60117.1 hypothetical protein GCM10010372_69880 [Streptomyces tauricus]
MSETNTMETAAADLRGTSAQAGDDGGQGRHRGPVSAQEDGAIPRGRHRRPAEQHDTGA